MVDYKEILNFYKGKRVLITGNTGFKGSWLSYILLSAGADVTGYALEPETNPSLFLLIGLDKEPRLHQVYGDIRDLECLQSCFFEVRPEVVFHLAAQPIVRESYKNPVLTYSTNVMGTVNICEAVRQTSSVRSFLNITTDKVYKNREWEYGYRENDELDGLDPYSNSKSCSELVTHSYRDSFFSNLLDDDGRLRVRVSTARAGNVIGGGDFSTDRIIPDCVRAISGDDDIKVRNPYSTRPYQHVLEPLFAYLLIAERQYEDETFAGYYNVGPDDCDCVSTGELATLFCDAWNDGMTTSDEAERKLVWKNEEETNAPHEANFLKLDCSKMKNTFGWQPRWHIADSIREVASWTRVWIQSTNSNDLRMKMDSEIGRYIAGE